MVGTDVLFLFPECLYIGLALAMQHWLLLVGSLAMPKQVWFLVINLLGSSHCFWWRVSPQGPQSTVLFESGLL